VALEKIEQHLEVGLKKLAPAYWGKPRISCGIGALLLEIQALEDVIWAQFEAQHIDTAPRTPLLKLAKLIGQEASQGFSLAGLRTVVKARALANRSRGRGPDIGLVLVALLGADNFSFLWAGPASIYITALDSISAEEVRMAEAVLPHSTGAGVQINFVHSTAGAGFMLWGDGEWGDEWASARAL
jgi:hypothetical protein